MAKKKPKKNAPSTRRKKLSEEEWNAMKFAPGMPKKEAEPETSGALASKDMRQFKLSSKPYEGGAPGLRSQQKK